jgi:O-antigen/teichoic acid export membrane protein
VPSYLSFRAQIALVGGFLGTETAGLFIYSKQIVNAAAQLVQMVRRVEFTNLVAGTNDGSGVFAGQRRSLGLAFLLAAGLISVAQVMKMGPGDVSRAGQLVTVFAPLIILSAAFAALHQKAFARGRSWLPAIATSASFFASTFVAYLLLPSLGIYALALAELLGALIGIGLILWRKSEDFAPHRNA